MQHLMRCDAQSYLVPDALRSDAMRCSGRNHDDDGLGFSAVDYCVSKTSRHGD